MAPVRSELTYLLVPPDEEVRARPPAEPWEQYHARRVAEHFTG